VPCLKQELGLQWDEAAVPDEDGWFVAGDVAGQLGSLQQGLVPSRPPARPECPVRSSGDNSLTGLVA